jgi:Na+-driven multidrug efflux pump
LFRVPLGYLLAQRLHLALFWVWSIMIVDHVTRAVWLSLAFKYGRWHERLGATRLARESDAPVADAA